MAQLTTEGTAFFVLDKPLRYTVAKTNKAITVPEGFVTDLASIPRGLWWWQGLQGPTMSPAIVHDYLYWTQVCSKQEADAVIYLAMLDAGVDKASARLVYQGVARFGNAAWRSNATARMSGEPRFFTHEYVAYLDSEDIDAQASLADIQARAWKRNGVAQMPSPDAATKGACAAALEEFRSRTGV